MRINQPEKIESQKFVSSIKIEWCWKKWDEIIFGGVWWLVTVFNIPWILEAFSSFGKENAKKDEFSEKFPTASDPPPSFSENHVAICSQC